MVPDTTLTVQWIDLKKNTGQWLGLWPVCYHSCHFPVCMPLTSALPLDTGCYEETCHNMFWRRTDDTFSSTSSTSQWRCGLYWGYSCILPLQITVWFNEVHGGKWGITEGVRNCPEEWPKKQQPLCKNCKWIMICPLPPYYNWRCLNFMLSALKTNIPKCPHTCTPHDATKIKVSPIFYTLLRWW